MKTSLLFTLLLTPAICYSEPSPLQNVACSSLNETLSNALTQYNKAYHGSVSVDLADKIVFSVNNSLYTPRVFQEIYINSLSELSELTSSAGELIFNKKLKPEGFDHYLEKFKHKCMTMKPLSAQVTSSNHDYSKK